LQWHIFKADPSGAARRQLRGQRTNGSPGLQPLFLSLIQGSRWCGVPTAQIA
jgi:hypothetical protein